VAKIDVVGVDELEPETRREEATDGRLSHPHETGEDYVAFIGRSRRGFRLVSHVISATRLRERTRCGHKVAK
jgi:hypothetical protein